MKYGLHYLGTKQMLIIKLTMFMKEISSGIYSQNV